MLSLVSRLKKALVVNHHPNFSLLVECASTYKSRKNVGGPSCQQLSRLNEDSSRQVTNRLPFVTAIQLYLKKHNMLLSTK